MSKKFIGQKVIENEKSAYWNFFFLIIADIKPARRHGADKKDVERDRSPNSDYFDRGRDVTRYPVDPNGPSIRSIVPFRYFFFGGVTRVMLMYLLIFFSFSELLIHLQVLQIEQMTVK